MIKNKFSYLLMTLIVALTLTSCKKYDEGPGLSFRSKKERVANDWIVEKAISNGNDVTSSYSSFTYKLTKGGAYETSINNAIVSKGTWRFDDKKDNFITKAENSSTESTNKILKLKEDEFWTLNENDKFEVHFKTK